MHLKDLKINEIAGKTFPCKCGITHDPGLEIIDISKNGIVSAIDFVLKKAKGRIIVICDPNTFKIAGKQVYDSLKEKHEDTEYYIIPERNGLAVVPNESFIGETMIRMPLDIDFFVAVGSGVVNDITRNISYHFGKKYCVIGTAPSMDGYASITSALIIKNLKESCPGQIPIGIFADIEILKNAPFKMLTAGMGDVLAKYNAVREWQFARDLNGEHYCKEIADLIWCAADKCAACAKQLKDRDEAVVKNIMEALILSGMAMGMYSNTRPGSGAEHHIVHYWDVEFIKKGQEHPLHGNSVGVALCVICKLFDIVKDKLPVKVIEIDTGKIIRILKSAGCETDPKALGIPKDTFRDSILYGQIMSKTKYTILTHLSRNNMPLLMEIADRLTREYYE
ncbi:MAG: sn-glycerol-1-phosphate dehydrogenase [Clostridia bacterium]